MPDAKFSNLKPNIFPELFIFLTIEEEGVRNEVCVPNNLKQAPVDLKLVQEKSYSISYLESHPMSGTA